MLHHGTSPAAAAVVLEEGLRPMGRQHVHLSTDTAMARSVGARKASPPILLVVRAREAHDAGVALSVGDDRAWLADAVPAAFLSDL